MCPIRTSVKFIIGLKFLVEISWLLTENFKSAEKLCLQVHPLKNVCIYKSIRSVLNKIIFKFMESREEQIKNFKTLKISGHITCKRYQTIDDDTRIPSKCQDFWHLSWFSATELRYEIRFLDPSEQDGAYNMLHIIWGIFRQNPSRNIFSKCWNNSFFIISFEWRNRCDFDAFCSPNRSLRPETSKNSISGQFLGSNGFRKLISAS